MPDPILPLSIITSFLSNLTIELLAEKISSWLAGLGDADRKNLNQAFKTICSDLAPAHQKQLKQLDEAKINIFKAAVYPIARYYSNDEKLDRIKKQLVTAIISQLLEPQALVDDFVSTTYSRMTIKSDPFIQAILDKLLEIAKQREPQILIKIIKDGESLWIHVLENGEERYHQLHEGKSFSEFKHDHFMIQTTTRRLVSLIARGGDFQQVLQENQQEIIKFGEKLYRLLFPEPISDRLKGYWEGLSSNEIDQLSVHIFSNDSAITNLPFELSYTPDIGYFFQQERINLSRFVFEETEPVSAEMERLAPPPLKILVVVSAPDDLKEQEKMLDYEREQELIIEALNPLLEHHSAQVHFTIGGSLAEIQTSLQNGNYHILHYSGHGAFEGDMGYLVLENEEGLTELVPADQFARSLEHYHSLQLITLSGCQTAQFSDYENLNGVAQCLIQAGFPMVIGMQRSIRQLADRAATSFAHHFYAQLAQQKGVNEALSATHQAMLREEQRFLKEGRDIIPGEWTIPVLIRKNEQNHIVDFRKAPVSEAGETPQRLLFSCARPLGRGFVGRRKEIRQFYQLYHAGNRAIALWGYGGVGKSSLATRLAEELNQRHDYHVFGFKGTVAPEIILSQLATLAGELMDQQTQQLILDPNADEPKKLQRLIDTLLTHHKLLVLFDNFEDNQTTDGAMIQPQLTDFLNRLIQRLPETTLVLFTTRYQMTELPVAEVNLGEFPFADTWKKMNRLAKLGSLATDNKRDIHYEIGGQPRSLELLDSILAEAETSWEAIKGKLAQVKKEAYDDLFLDILWGNLTPVAQNLLQWLSLFRALMVESELRKFSEFRLNPPDIASLQRMSLLFSVTVPDVGTWHYVHRLTAAFVLAEERLSLQEFRNRHNRVGDYCKEYFETSKSLDDLLEARYHYLQAKNIKEANSIAFTAEDMLSCWGFLDAALHLNKETLELAIDDKDRAYALHNMGIIHQSQGDLERALELYNKSLAIEDKLGDISGVIRSYHQIGMVHQAWGDYSRALELYRRSLSIAESIGDIDQVSLSYHQMGMVHQARGDLEQALDLYGKSLAISEKLGDISGVGSSYHQMGMVYQDQGDYDRALELYSKSLTIAQKMGEISSISRSYHQIGVLYYLRRNYESALVFYSKSLAIDEKLGDISGISSTYHNMAAIYQARGDYEHALGLYSKSLAIAEKLSDISGISRSYHQMGLVHQARGDYESAKELYSKSLAIFEKLGDINGAASSYGQLGLLNLQLNNYEIAAEYFIKELMIYMKIGSPNIELSKKGLARVQERIGEKKIREIYKQLGIENPFKLPPTNESASHEMEAR